MYDTNESDHTTIRIRRGAQDRGERIHLNDESVAPELLIAHLEEFPVRSLIIDVTTERTLVSLLCDNDAIVDFLPAPVVADLVRRGYVPLPAHRALVEARIIAAAGGPLPDEIGGTDR